MPRRLRTWVLGAGAIVVLIVGWMLFFGEPSAESEVQTYLRTNNLHRTVTVRSCGWSDPGSGGSETDLYWCDLEASRAARLPGGQEAVLIRAGQTRVCFAVPRADRAWGSQDFDARPIMRLAADRTCFWRHS